MTRRARKSLLFVPGSSPAMIRTSSVVKADSLLFDLEDAVASGEKDAARFLVRRALESIDFGDRELAVRINPLYTPWGPGDLEFVAAIPQVHTVLLPKANPDYVVQVDRALEGTDKEILCLIESAIGLEKAYETATASRRVNGLILGAEDLASDMAFERTPEGQEIAYARYTVSRAAHAAGVQPIDTPYVTIDDLEGVERDARAAKSFGYTAKACISPFHVPVVNQVFSPTEEEVAYARRVVQAADEAEKRGLGAVQLDGKMIDLPIVARAKRILMLAGEVE